MYVLIVHASAGAGHRRAAEAVFNHLAESRPDLKLKIVDVLDKTNALFKFDYTVGYSFVIKYMVSLWNFAFWLTEFKLFRFISLPLASFINYINSIRFIRFLIRENPDVIISTHFLPSDIAAFLKREKRIKSKLVTIITDFGVHPYWIADSTDLYIAASDFTKDRLMQEGVNKDIIKVFGLPYCTKFSVIFDRVALGKKIGIDPNVFTILLMTGSFGIGPLEKIAELLCKEYQVIVVCASNEKLYHKMLRRNLPNVKVFGYVDNTEELMAVSDIIITKAGGSTIAEVINMELIPIFISVIPGQEEGNVEALAEFGIGMTPSHIRQIKYIVSDLKNNPLKIEEIKERIRKVKKPFTCQEIADVIR